MKKALMVIGLAMCTTLAFAQTQRFEQQNRKVNLNDQKVSVDYKASIFTKDGEADTLATFTFAATEMTGFVYGSDGTITSSHGNTTINGHQVSYQHTQNGDAPLWQRIPDSAYLGSEAYNETYNNSPAFLGYLRNYMGGRYSIGGDNGFMLMHMYAAEHGGGNINAYFSLPTVANHEGVTVLDVTFLQIYSKFNYDSCFVDYKIGNNWKSWEINVKGVDVNTNDFASLRPVYTMPFELAEQANINLRVRWCSNSWVGGTYGYVWAIDDFCIVAGETNRWKHYAEHYVDGAYGTMPQNMKLPLTWYSTVANNGSNDRENVQAVVRHIDANGTSTVMTQSLGTFEADPVAQNNVLINERNLVNLDSAGYWWWGFGNYYDTENVPTGYHYLPVENTGAHYTTVSLASTGVDTLEFDTVRYNVVNRTGDNYNYGYRWSHDNGIVPNNSAYTLGYTVDEGSGQALWSDVGGYEETGYTVAVRYTTGSEIPVDPVTGERWALLGIEMVPTTVDSIAEFSSDVQLQPVAMTFHYTNGGNNAGFLDVNTGFSVQNNFMVNADDHTNIDAMPNGYFTPSSDYNKIILEFPNQPYLEPNISYYLGYQMMSAGSFAVAATRNGFYEDNTYVPYYENQTTAPYATQFAPGGMDVYMYDAAADNGSVYAGEIEASYPMIRAIVGPRIPRPQYTVTALCDEDSNFFGILNAEKINICGDRDTAFEGAAATYYVYVPDIDNEEESGEDQHHLISELIIDGTSYTIDLSDGSVEGPDFTYIRVQNDYVYADEDEEQVALWRHYYIISFEDISANHTLSAKTIWKAWDLGIDPVANDCVLGVQPNPATSQVKVNISGVTGMVNCNVIDMSGRVVYNSDFNAEQGHSIDLSSFARGAYFVRVTNGTFSKIEKLIVR